MFGQLPMVEPTMQKEAQIVLRTRDDLEHAIFALQFHYAQATLKGKEIVLELWLPYNLQRRNQ